MVHGDRIEPLGCAIVCCLNNIKIAHFEGGELSGTVDEILDIQFLNYVTYLLLIELLKETGQMK